MEGITGMNISEEADAPTEAMAPQHHPLPYPPQRTPGNFYPPQFDGPHPGDIPSPMYHFMGTGNPQIPWSNGSPPPPGFQPPSFPAEGPTGRQPTQEEMDNYNLSPLSPMPQRERFSYTRYQLSLLNGIYQRIKYPNTAQKHLIAKRLGITRDQVKIWFQNRRRKDVVDSRMAHICKAPSKPNDDPTGVPPHILGRVVQELLCAVKDGASQSKTAGDRRTSNAEAQYNASRRLDDIDTESTSDEQPNTSSTEENVSSPLITENIPPPPPSLDALLDGLEPGVIVTPMSRSPPDSGNPSSPSCSNESGSPSLPERAAVVPTNDELDMIAPPNVVVPNASNSDNSRHSDSPRSSPNPPQQPPPQMQEDNIAQGPPNVVAPAQGQPHLNRDSTGFWRAVETGKVFHQYPDLPRNLPDHYFDQQPQPQEQPPDNWVFPFPAIAQAARCLPNQPPGRMFMVDAYQQPSMISSYPNPFYARHGSGVWNPPIPNAWHDRSAPWQGAEPRNQEWNAEQDRGRQEWNNIGDANSKNRHNPPQ